MLAPRGLEKRIISQPFIEIFEYGLRTSGWCHPLGYISIRTSGWRASADAVQVHRTTSFRWRHRMVAGFIHERAARLGGVARHRGVGRDHDCLLVACERDGPTLDFHCGRGPVSLAELDQCLGPVLAPDAWLISDGAAAYRAFAKHRGIRHEAINLRAGERARGAVHLNHVNGWHSRFKRWLARFNGVASRYLAHYSGWRRVLDVGSPATPHQLLKAAVKAD